MIDLHVHSNFSGDSNCLLESYLKKAEQLKIKRIGFSDHFDYDYEVRKLPIRIIDDKKYCERVAFLKDKYAGKIDILFGAEFAYDEIVLDKYVETAKKYQFDYVINSVHLIDGVDPWFGKFYEGKTKFEAYRLYLEKVLESLDAPYPFEVVGHIGYIRRKAPYEDTSLTMKEFGVILDKIFLKIIKMDKAMEINSSTKGVADFLPEFELIERFVALGGRKFTFGTDSHEVDRLKDGEEKVKSALKLLGITGTYHFVKREEVFDKF